MNYLPSKESAIIELKLLYFLIIDFLFVDYLASVEVVLDKLLYSTELHVLKHKFKHALIIIHVQKHSVELSILSADASARNRGLEFADSVWKLIKA